MNTNNIARTRIISIIALLVIVLTCTAATLNQHSGARIIQADLEDHEIAWHYLEDQEPENYNYIVSADAVEMDGQVVLKYVTDDGYEHDFVSQRIAENWIEAGDTVKIYIEFLD